MSTETTNKKIKIDNGTTFGRTYTDKAVDAKLPTDLIASANKLSLGVGNAPLGSGVNLSGFTYDEATKTLKASGGGSIPVVEGTTAELTEEEQSFGAIAKWSIPTAQSNNFIFHEADDDGWYFMSCSAGSYYCNFIVPDTLNYIFYGTETFIYLLNNTTATTNTIPYYVIDSFNNGIHNQQGFSMPTEDVVLFTDGRTSLIGNRKMIDNIAYYYCYEWKPQIEGGLKTYKNFAYKISKSNAGFKIETIDISQELNYNLMFLPNYRDYDNGKVLSVVNGEAQWASADTNIPSLPADASTSTYVLKAVNGTVQWVKEA